MKTSVSKSRRRACIALVASAIGAPTKAAAADDAGQIATSYFLLPADFDLTRLQVDPPPTDDLTEAKVVWGMRNRRTPARIAQIRAQAINPLPLFWECAGAKASAHPVAAQRIEGAVADTEYVVTAFKRRFNRRRPSVVLPEIQTVVPVPPYASYPSGHATQAVVIASLLAQVAPKVAERLQQFAVQVGRNREIAGLHYPSDTNAGFNLGRQLAEIFLQV